MVTGRGLGSVQTGHDSVVGHGGGGVVRGQVGHVTVGGHDAGRGVEGHCGTGCSVGKG